MVDMVQGSLDVTPESLKVEKHDGQEDGVLHRAAAALELQRVAEVRSSVKFTRAVIRGPRTRWSLTVFARMQISISQTHRADGHGSMAKRVVGASELWQQNTPEIPAGCRDIPWGLRQLDKLVEIVQSCGIMKVEEIGIQKGLMQHICRPGHSGNATALLGDLWRGIAFAVPSEGEAFAAVRLRLVALDVSLLARYAPGLGFCVADTRAFGFSEAHGWVMAGWI